MTTKKTAGAVSASATSKKPAAKKPATRRSTAPKKEETQVEEETKEAVKTEEAPQEESQQKDESADTVAEVPRHLGIDVVIPYVAKLAKGDELLYAVRAWQKNFKELGRIIIVGDHASWFGGDIIHIAHKRVNTNPQIDVADKLATVIASELVNDAFVWSNDDIYPVAPVYPEDILVRKAMGTLTEKGAAGGVYRENSIRTVQALAKRKLARIYDYATHMPVAFEKDKLAETLTEYKCQKEGFLISSLYFNTHFPDERPIITRNDDRGSIVASVWSSSPNPTILKRVFEERKFINHNDKGWPHVLPYLKNLFPEKSRWEK
ncbi:hypothetical protein [uncultured Algoriphagus sp.]|uniref:hypothetical protein n=1 Tax=uncultured Algoriphagus sp. TaxID=417365 RepID=UPI002588B7E9|nr:hypothetical protein [uncultured Algoriphagus sp.]